MHALSDEQRIDALETSVAEGFERMDRGFAEMRKDSSRTREDVREMRADLREMREDFREIRGQITTWGVAILAMWLTIIFGFAGIIIAMITQF